MKSMREKVKQKRGKKGGQGKKKGRTNERVK